MLDHESPLNGYHRTIGGSAGMGTHGGRSIKRPKDMPARDDCEVVHSPADFARAVQRDGNSVYIGGDIDLSDYVDANGTIQLGSDVTIVGGYCDPKIPGRGSELICETNGHRVLQSGYQSAPTLYGVSFRGPRLDYFDPDHTASGFSDKQSTGLFCHDTDGTLELIGCELRGWTMAGLEVGARNRETHAIIRRSSFHHCSMEHLGYGIEQYNGRLTMDRCFFDACRHGMSSFGYPTCSWALTNSIVGPNDWAGHALDMHSLANNLSGGDNTAGGDIRIKRCTLMITEDIASYGQEAFALRGVPAGEARIEQTQFFHSERPTEPNVQGNAYRQENDRWQNFYISDCVFGPDQNVATVGAPRAEVREPDEPPDSEDGSSIEAVQEAVTKLTNRVDEFDDRLTNQESRTQEDIDAMRDQIDNRINSLRIVSDNDSDDGGSQ